MERAINDSPFLQWLVALAAIAAFMAAHDILGGLIDAL